MRNSCPKISLIALILLLLTASGVTADFSRSDWRYVKDITLPRKLSPENLVEFAPDTEVYAGASEGLADLRIISGNNEEIPYKLEISKAESERNSFSVSIHDKGYVPGGHDVFTIELGQAGIIHNEIEIITTEEDFSRNVIIEASNDESSWMQVAEQTIYAITVENRGFITRDTRIRYPDSTARYLRVFIADDGEGSLDINGARVFYVKEIPASETQWPSTILETYRDSTEQTTNVEIDLGSAGLPSSRLVLNIPDTNFYRSVNIERGSNRETWSSVLRRANIYAFETTKYTARNVSITYPETTARYLRIVIHDEDSPPLTVEGVKVWGLSRRIVFTADPGQSYRLYYGNTKAGRPSYDIEKIFPYLTTEALPEAGLSFQMDNPDFAEELPPVSERFPWLFPTVIGVAAVIVALLLLIIFRQVRKSLPPPEE